MKTNILQTLTAFLIISGTAKAQDANIITTTSMGYDAQVKSVTTERQNYSLKNNAFGYSSGTETYIFESGNLLKELRTKDHTGTKSGIYEYQNHKTGALQLKRINYKGNHVKRGEQSYHQELFYSKTNPDSIFELKEEYKYYNKHVEPTLSNPLLTLKQIITYSKKGEIENLKQFSSGKLFKEYRYSKNKEDMDLYSSGKLLWNEKTNFKNGLKLSEVNINPEGKFIEGKKYMYDDKGNLIKIFLTNEKGAEIELLQQSIYLYKNNYWVARCFQNYEKTNYNPEELRLEKRSITLKDNTKLEASDTEIETFIKQHLNIAVKTDKQ